jgi:hypothetical protein
MQRAWKALGVFTAASALVSAMSTGASADINYASGPVGFGGFATEGHTRHKTYTGPFTVTHMLTTPCGFDSCAISMELVNTATGRAFPGCTKAVSVNPGDVGRRICASIPAGSTFRVMASGHNKGQWTAYVDY